MALPETPVIVKPTEVLDQAVGVDSDTSKDNGIADYKGGPGGPGGNPGEPVDQPEAVTSITAEYWVTNSKVTAGGKNSLTIDATDATDSRIVSETGASVESLAPAEGTNVGGTAIFWQARVLPSDKYQTEGGGIDRTGDGQKIQKIRYFNSKFQYQVENNDNWTDFNTDKNSGNQLVFYYLIKTDFAENIQINVSDWPALKEPKKSDNRDHYNNYRKVTYQVYRMDENDIAESNPCDSKDTWYYSGVKISAVQVSKNELESCSIDRIEVSHTDTLKNGENPSVDSSSNADFRIDLSKVLAHTNVVVKIYVKVNKYLVTYKSDGEVFHREAYKATTEVNQLTRIPKKEGFTFKGWTSEDVTVSNNKFTMPAKDVVFTAVWEENKTPVTPTEPTKAVDAKYFVLLPGGGTPASGADQGTSYYLPNKTNNGGITGLTYLTGYTGGGLTAAGQAAANASYTNIDSTNGVFNRAGIDASYLVVPTNLGYFTVGNWTAEGVYSPTSTSKAALSNVLGENFNTKNISIIWYSLKKQLRDGRVVYHVDGYVKDIPVTLTYHDNFTGSNDSYKQTGLKSGDEITIAPNSKVNNKTTFSHDGYVFAGWYDNAAGSGTNYAGQTHTMMDNLNLYAKWEPATTLSYTVNYLEKDTNKVLHTSKTEPNQTFEDTITATDEVIDIDGYIYDSADKDILTIGTSENVINLYYVKRTNLSYTVNYLEKGSNTELHASKTESNRTFEDTITATDEVIDIDGYTYNSADKDILTIGTSGNVINLYYVKRTDLSYTVNYLEKGTNKVLHAPKTESDKTFENTITAVNEKIDIAGYKYDSVSPETLTIGTDVSQNVINVYYTELAKYNIVIHYVDDTSAQNKLQDDVTISQLEGSTYNVADKIHNRIGEYVKETENAPVAGTLTANVEITVVYTKDVLVDSTVPTTDGPGDNIPDKYQVTINYVSSDTTIGRITGRTQEVLTIREDKQPTNKGTVQASGSTAEATGSRNYFSNWTKEKKDGTQVGANTTLEPLEIKDAEGGKTYTFYANFYHRSSSGGGSRPTVTIPDDVPTGLNGKDHYAYIIGYGNNDVRPQNNITRAEVATIFFRLLTDETREANMTKSNGYNDVKDGDWFCCAVSTLSKMGIIKGYEDGSFKPNDPISRAEFAAIAARFDPDGDKTPATFADVTSHWAKDEISIAANHGWIKGYEDGSFKPDQKITRAETMTLVNRVLNRLPEAKDDLHKDMKTWVDNMDETAWYYLAVQEATNSHYFKNKTSTKFEQWTDLRDTRDWSELEK